MGYHFLTAHGPLFSCADTPTTAYPSACDSQQPLEDPPGPPLPHSDTDAAHLESRFVHAVYEEIAGHFSGTRHSPWPRVAAFLRSLAPGALLLDVGCGNGKYLGLRPDVFAVRAAWAGLTASHAANASIICLKKLQTFLFRA